MKKEKLIKSIKNIDDDLICEAMNRRSEETPPIEEKAEIISVSGGKRRSGQLWKYPVTAAALLGVIGGAVFVANNINTVQESMDYSGETRTQTGEETVKTEESSVNNTEGAVTEEIVNQATPIKVVDIFESNYLYTPRYKVFCTDSLPTVPSTTLGKECFNEMSTEELFKYYGLEFMLPVLIDDKRGYGEIVDESIPHGIYTSDDGKIEDINTFVFASKEEYVDSYFFPNKLTVTVGKCTKFGQEYDYGHESFNFDKMCYNEENDTFFAVYNIRGSCTVMISGKSDDIMKFTENDYVEKRFLNDNDGISPSSFTMLQGLFNLFLTEVWDENRMTNEKDIDEITGAEKVYYNDRITGEQNFFIKEYTK